MTAPTMGKKLMAYFMLFSFQSAFGIGSLEYVEKAIMKESII
jgi:hypothetical protein